MRGVEKSVIIIISIVIVIIANITIVIIITLYREMLSCVWGRTERSPSLRTPSLPGTVTPLLALSLLSFLLSSMSLFLSCTFIIVILLVINRPAHLCNGSADTVESSSLYHTQAVYQDLVMINILTSKFKIFNYMYVYTIRKSSSRWTHSNQRNVKLHAENNSHFEKASAFALSTTLPWSWSQDLFIFR